MPTAMSEIPSTIGTPSFTEAEISQLQKDDLTAGKFIGRTLVLMFLCSVILMGGVIWWTQGTIAERGESPTQSAVTVESK